MLVPVKLQLVSRPTPVSSSSARSGFHSADLLSDLVQQGVSEKVALVVNFLAAFVTGFALAYAKSWRLALALSSILPCIAITGGVMNKFISSYMQ